MSVGVLDLFTKTTTSRPVNVGNNKYYSIRHRLVNGSWAWEWSGPVNVGRSKVELYALILDIANLETDEVVDSDSCIWSLSHDNIFSMNSTRKHSDDHTLSSLSPSARCCKVIPKKLLKYGMPCKLVTVRTHNFSRKNIVDRLDPGTIRHLGTPQKGLYYQGPYHIPHPSLTAKQLEDIQNFKQERDESLYQAWERGSSNSSDGLAALVNKLDNLGRDMKKLTESVHAIQVGCQICEGPHLDKDCPLNEEVKQVEEDHLGTTLRRITDHHMAKKRQSLEELLAKHQEESARRSTEMEIEQLTKEIRSNKTLEQVKIIIADQETSGLERLHGVSFISDPESKTAEVLQHQLSRKELNSGNFTLPCTIGKFNFYAMADLGASINVMPRSMFEHLKLTNLRKTNMLCEMVGMSKKAPLGIVKNVLVKIGKFLFLSDFVIIDNTPSEIAILGRPFLATIHAEIDVFAGKISLGVNENRISFNSMRNNNMHTKLSERIFMVRPQSPAQCNNQIDYEEPGNWDNRSLDLGNRKPKKQKIEMDKNVPKAHFCNPIKQNIKEQTKML
ncbi:reverse transcriptase domain-containing protein [Tanacetum coccineum]